MPVLVLDVPALRARNEATAITESQSITDSGLDPRRESSLFTNYYLQLFTSSNRADQRRLRLYYPMNYLDLACRNEVLEVAHTVAMCAQCENK